MQKKLWLFGTYAWQGNPKALFLYMNKYCAETHECWWIADTEKDAENIKKSGIKNATFLTSGISSRLFSNADVYVTENFRENYPAELSDKTIIFNTWHGVGLKHIELELVRLGIGQNYSFITSVMRKNIKNFSIYRDQTKFLVTSKAMEEHFIKDTVIKKENVIRGQYPRNIVYKDQELITYSLDEVLPQPKEQYNNIILFAPTHRFGGVNHILFQLLPDFSILEKSLEQSAQLLIVKVHPMMKQDPYFLEMQDKYSSSKHILFWNDEYDIYEIFSHISTAIIDYSSIFYDLLNSGVSKFIRYIPDFDKYQNDVELIGDYFDLSAGEIVQDFNELVTVLTNNDIKNIKDKKKEYLNTYFFEYDNYASIQEIVDAIDNCTLPNFEEKELHSFDIFDTLIRRKTLKPFSVFEYVRDKAKQSNIEFPVHLLEDWVTIRNRTEHDVRDMMRKTTFERQSNTLEITLDDIYHRLQNNFNLSNSQIEFLKQAEIEAEIQHVEPIQKRIDLLLRLKEEGKDIILISDMYLPEHVIREMLIKADGRLKDIPLYLSATIGYQKSTGKLYQYIFSNIDYKYSRWVHYGDNKHADGSVPRSLGIETIVHDIDDFIPFETALITSMDNYNRYPAYQLATKMHRYRSSLLSTMNNTLLEQKYYAYAYAGSALVPYIHWVIEDALVRGYETLYFISRDGHFLKQIADKIIEIRKYPLNTKYIYGSRKLWRLPSFIDKVDDETFGVFGNFVGMDSFDDLVKASYLSESELLELFPEFESLRHSSHLRGQIAENIRKIMANSDTYHKKVLKLAKEKRGLVTQYIKQEINPNEKFAFVEFWGRGYTQDVFGRLLNHTFGKEITNPFYYVRSFTNNIGTSLRHNFILTPQNFSFFEPIFANTPYESISEYVLENGKVEPVIKETDRYISDIISEGLLNFTQDYLNLDIMNESYFTHALAKFTYNYQLTTYNDQFICNVFGELKDNISSFGNVKSYAPALTIKQLQNISSKQDLDKLTLSIPMSLAKSSDDVVQLYNKIQKNYKLPAINIEPMKKTFAVNELDWYVYSNKLPFEIIALQNNSFYMDVSFSETSKRKDIYLKKFNTIEVIGIDWLKNGVPRLLTHYGYITANKEWVQNFADVQNDFVKLENEEGYQWKPSFSLSSLIKVAIKENGLVKPKPVVPAPKQKVPAPKPKAPEKSAVSKPTKIVSKKETEEQLSSKQRKFAKFARDPFNFFKDAKNRKVARLKFFFDPKHKLGRYLSKFVRTRFN